jgi:hypothetical protein
VYLDAASIQLMEREKRRKSDSGSCLSVTSLLSLLTHAVNEYHPFSLGPCSAQTRPSASSASSCSDGVQDYESQSELLRNKKDEEEEREARS